MLSAGQIDGIQYYTMPFVEGESLRAKLARDGALQISEVVSVLRDVTRALAYAHAHGVVHRDIKPDNVLLSGGTAVVTDFGIAKAISAARTTATNTALTQLGTSVGTPAYISPEQAAEIALAEKRPLDAVREFWRSDSLSDGPVGDCYFCKDVLIGRAYDLANMPDSAVMHFERFLGAKYPGRLSIDGEYLPAVHKRLGELYDAKGEAQRAASHYVAFIDLWKNADPELQPKVQEAKRRLSRLEGISGR